MVTFVVAHGAWSAGFAWRKMHPLMLKAGHRLVTPTYTGLGERVHLAHDGIDLDTHITDVTNVLFHEDLSDVVLIGHSYGGMVATGVADRATERLRQIIYLDAFVPRSGQCLFDCLPEAERKRRQEGAATEGDGWRLPPSPIPPDTAAEDVAWLMPRRHFQPLATFAQPLTLAKGETKLPRSYIYCSRTAPGDVFGQFSKR
ncbi:MAG: alpha/beta hydrolase, partial [Parvularculaceae bacterium]|nr:alpha/beta hydrolase [Parvularculaceae bacterium]